MNAGFIYRHPYIYGGVVRLLYGKNFIKRYEAIAAFLPDYATVADVCCGDCYLSGVLARKRIRYIGLDINPIFVGYALRRGIDARLLDIKRESMPRVDYVIMQGSLYQFAPDHRAILNKLFSASSAGMVISEPTRHASNSRNGLLSFCARHGTSIDGDVFPQRFSREEVLGLFREFGVAAVTEISGGRDIVGFFKKTDGEQRDHGQGQ